MEGRQIVPNEGLTEKPADMPQEIVIHYLMTRMKFMLPTNDPPISQSLKTDFKDFTPDFPKSPS
jgi:hypothetical protein